jgi:uncharacterized protein (DUF983 family)
VSNVIAILRGHCPRCRRGQLFQPGIKGLLFMNDECSVCGLRFLRESGYYLGAIYVSYGLGVLTVLPVALYLAVSLDWSLPAVFAVMIVQTLVSMLLFVRMSRAVWLYVDQALDPQHDSRSASR